MISPAPAAPPQTATAQLAAYLADDMAGVNGAISAHLHSDIALIPQVADYLISAGGKRLRPMLAVAAARLCGDETTRPHALAAAVEFIHSASLLHDDVVDESSQRRGRPSANQRFGNQAAVLVGDFLFARAFEFMVSTGHLAVLKVLATASTRITEGEVLQLSLAGKLDTREEDYLAVIGAKTAALFSAATETGALLGAGAHSAALRDYGYHLGMAFQMIDDLLDYAGDASVLNKNMGDDFREGKLTLPVILALQGADAAERAFWQSALGGGDADFDADVFARAQSLLHRHDVFAQVREKARIHALNAAAALGGLPSHPLLPVLKSLPLEILSREV